MRWEIGFAGCWEDAEKLCAAGWEPVNVAVIHHSADDDLEERHYFKRPYKEGQARWTETLGLESTPPAEPTPEDRSIEGEART